MKKLFLLLIIGVSLIFLFNPNFLADSLTKFILNTGGGGTSQSSDLKHNMHTIQNVIEEFARHKKKYPQNIEEVILETKKLGYWKELRNPYTGKETNYINLKVPISETNNYFNNKNIEKGTIAYFFSKDNYKIYAFSDKGNPFEIKGKIFYLSNN